MKDCVKEDSWKLQNNQVIGPSVLAGLSAVISEVKNKTVKPNFEAKVDERSLKGIVLTFWSEALWDTYP